ncbi:hypothetical protein KC19_1G243300 [Ceratodon purpureus]|uniref:Uncharacterized protein n=1 Tax=Ceratodon purpureus TaxID=3225 RepID=A0A8T0J8V0_CERPU|nr:hypothetical protein KC19_1G243300 [Ceratodon purpureus]
MLSPVRGLVLHTLCCTSILIATQFDNSGSTTVC